MKEPKAKLEAIAKLEREILDSQLTQEWCAFQWDALYTKNLVAKQNYKRLTEELKALKNEER
jgi:hypothetical protein